MSESPTISDAPLTEDILCMRCGYNLRTRRPSEICPECALPVAPSIQYHADGSNIVPHPTLAALSLTFLAMVFGVRFLMTILYVLQPPFAAVRLLYYALALGDTFLLMASVFLLLFAQRSSRATTPLLRSLTSASLLAYAITNLLLIAYYAIHYLYWSLIRSPLRFTMSQWSIFAGTLLAGVTVIA